MAQIKLQVFLEGAEPKSFSLEGQSLSIGRGEGCDLRLNHQAISRVHAKLYYHPSRGWLVADMDSRNGVLWNGERLERSHTLQAGDKLRMGPIEVRVEDIVEKSDAIRIDGGPAPMSNGPDQNTEFSVPRPPAVRKEGGKDRMFSQKPAGKKLGTLHRAESLTADYLGAMVQAKESYDRLWQVVKSRTPPSHTAEMAEFNQGVDANFAKLETVAKGIRASTDRLCRLVEAARIISAPQPLRERLETILDLAISQMGADCGFLMLYSRRLRGLQLSLQRNMSYLQDDPPLTEDGPAPNRPSEAIARMALKSGSTVFERFDPGAANGDSKDSFGRMMAGQGIHAAICAPMKVEGRFLGLIYVDFRDPARLGAEPVGGDDADWLESLASLAALAVENARLIQKSQRSRRAQAGAKRE